MKRVGLLGPPFGESADVGECDTPIIGERELEAAEHALGFAVSLAMGGCPGEVVRAPAGYVRAARANADDSDCAVAVLVGERRVNTTGDRAEVIDVSVLIAGRRPWRPVRRACAPMEVDELQRLHRFTHEWEATASLQLRSGHPAFAAYEAHDRIIPGTDDHLAAMAESWIERRHHGETQRLQRHPHP